MNYNTNTMTNSSVRRYLYNPVHHDVQGNGYGLIKRLADATLRCVACAHIYILLISVALLTGCAADDVLETIEPEVITDTNVAMPDETEGVRASIPELIDGNAVNDGVASRSSLAYDRSTKKMAFSWGAEADVDMSAFQPTANPIGPEDYSKSPLNFKRSGWTSNQTSGPFVPTDPSYVTSPGKSYIAFRPSDGSDIDNYLAKEVYYDRQNNHGYNVKMKEYKSPYTEYDKSEAEASSHLGDYDHLVSNVQTANSDGNIYFSLLRVGVVVRFYLVIPPDAYNVYDELQLVTQNAPLFTLQGTLNLTNREVTATKSSNVITLKYGDNGIDMSNTEDSEYYYGTGDKRAGYIVSYMMLAPIDLSSAEHINLYLVSHTKPEFYTYAEYIQIDGNNSVTEAQFAALSDKDKTKKASEKKYYKSVDLSKPNLTANMFYQWLSNKKTSPDTPITFTEVTFKDFEEGTAINNGDSGSGTEGW